jgi:hypothetical protein
MIDILLLASAMVAPTPCLISRVSDGRGAGRRCSAIGIARSEIAGAILGVATNISYGPDYPAPQHCAAISGRS